MLISLHMCRSPSGRWPARSRRAGHTRDRSGLDQVDRAIDGAACGVGRRALVVPAGPSLQLAQWSERRADLGSEEFRLFPRREVTALVDLVKVDELVIGTLGPALWRTIDLARKHRHRNRDRDVRCLLLH